MRKAPREKDEEIEEEEVEEDGDAAAADGDIRRKGGLGDFAAT